MLRPLSLLAALSIYAPIALAALYAAAQIVA